MDIGAKCERARNKISPWRRQKTGHKVGCPRVSARYTATVRVKTRVHGFTGTRSFRHARNPVLIRVLRKRRDTPSVSTRLTWASCGQVRTRLGKGIGGEDRRRSGWKESQLQTCFQAAETNPNRTTGKLQ